MTLRVVQDPPSGPRDVREHPVVRTMNAIVAVMMVPYHVTRFFTRYWTNPKVLLRMAPIREDEGTHAVGPEHEADVPPAILEYLARTETTLVQRGFTPPLRTTSSSLAKITGVASLMEHPANGDLVNVIAIQRAALTTVLSFTSEFADGRRVVTTNIDTMRYWPPEPGIDAVRFPGEHDVLELYRLHRARVERRARRVAQRPATRGATEAARLAHAEAEAQRWRDHLVAIGYRRRTPEGLSPTRRGAYLGAWRALFPWLTFTRWRERRAADAVRAMVRR